MSLVSWFKGLFHKNKESQGEVVALGQYSEPMDIKHFVISLCEQMIDVSKDMEDIRGEYETVTSYLNDIQIIESLQGSQKEQLLEIATSIFNLTKVRDEYINIEQNISDATYNQMKELEDEIPDAIRRLKSNETYLDTIKKDMNYLAAEKVEWSVLRQEKTEEREYLKKLSTFFLFFFGGIAVVVLILSVLYEWDLLPLIIVAFLATLCGSYVVLRTQDCNQTIRKCDANKNRAITLENRVKIKFVNMKNAVDYACQKYHVKNSEELTYNYEQFIEISKEREKLKETNEDLHYFSNKLIRYLLNFHLYDAKIWPNHASAIVNPKDMVELKHDLFTRRQSLREQMEYNRNAIAEMREDAKRYCDIMEDKTPQIQQIISKIDEISKIYS